MEQTQPTQESKKPVAYAIFDIKYGGSEFLIWADQYTPDGDPTRFKVVPLYSNELEKPVV